MGWNPWLNLFETRPESNEFSYDSTFFQDNCLPHGFLWWGFQERGTTQPFEKIVPDDHGINPVETWTSILNSSIQNGDTKWVSSWILVTVAWIQSRPTKDKLYSRIVYAFRVGVWIRRRNHRRELSVNPCEIKLQLQWGWTLEGWA